MALIGSVEYVEDLIRAAEAHGKTCGEHHEVANLREALRACWTEMTPDQRRQVVCVNIRKWMTGCSS